MTDQLIRPDEPPTFTREHIAEVRADAARWELRLTTDLEPWHRAQLEFSLADARDWLEEFDRG